jgi:glycyl-tRNA synthetase
MPKDFMKDFQSFIQNKGFIWGPFPELYGGFSGFYNYGPLGKLLKNKVENSVRRIFQSHGLWELESPTILPDIVWKASGHLDTFSDPIIEDEKGHKFRADKVVENHLKKPSDHLAPEQLLELIKKHKIKSPSGHKFKDEIKLQSLMIKTLIAGQEASLRPETATATYLDFKRYHEFFRKKLPLGIFQIGKAYRNEISPRQHVLRSREFTQAEGQILIDPKEKNNWEKFDTIKKDQLPLWTSELQKKNKSPSSISLNDAIKKKIIKTKAYAWCIWLAYHQFISMGIPANKIRLRQHHEDEKAFYADDAWDIEIKLNSFSWVECCGIHDRTDYDLLQHSKHSKQDLQAAREDGSKFTPHILEIAFGTDRPTFALLDLFYNKKSEKEGKTTFKIPYNMAPIDIAIFPLMKKPELVDLALKIKEDLEKHFIIEYDQSGSIGKRYLRAAEAGTSYCLTIDYDSLKNNDVTCRDRDSEKQIRIKVDDLKDILTQLIDKEIKFEKAGKLIK